MGGSGGPVVLCRGCGHLGETARAVSRCPRCFGPRVVAHPELASLAVAHVDCDAFYAAIEKRDDPSLRDRPVIVGGGRRGVVTTCCYIARISGVRSAMPMFKALKACPDAVVIRPDFRKYAEVGREIRHRMQALTPLVEPVSIDEAYLDLSGTERLHGAPAAAVLAAFQRRVEGELGITVSVGLSFNKLLAKFASDLDKPRGFAVIGRADAEERLAAAPLSRLPGVGPVGERRIREAGFHSIADLQAATAEEAIRRLGAAGPALKARAHGLDERPVNPHSERKSVSAEETFDADLAGRGELLAILRHLAEKVSTRLKAVDIAGRTVTLKLKTTDFRVRTRASRLPDPTQLAHRIYSAAKPLLERELDEGPFRLVGIGLSDLVDDRSADPADLVDPGREKARAAEAAIDRLRARFGEDAIALGITLPVRAAKAARTRDRAAEAARPRTDGPPKPTRRGPAR